jgi:hypothetical protein
VNVSATENGIYKFIGMLNPPMAPPINLVATPLNHDVHLTWDAPSTPPTGYNMYRNGLKLNATPIAAQTYDDMGVTSGHYTYCVKALYTTGESDGSCADVDVAVGISPVSLTSLSVYPNPASGELHVSLNIPGGYIIQDVSGTVVKSGCLKPGTTVLGIGELPAGLYFLRIPSAAAGTKFIKM